MQDKNTNAIPGQQPVQPAAAVAAQKQKRGKETLLYGSLFGFGVLACILAELWFNAGGGFTGNAFWAQFVLPFSLLIRENLLNLYVSQISTTFLVTAFLSFLSGNNDTVYWTTLVEYKLINPRGTSLQDITWYCFGALATSFIAVMLQTTLAFLVSFMLSIVGLVVITCRMLGIFFSKEKIKKELKDDFRRQSPAGQKQMLIRLEENLISAVRRHDVGCIRDDLEFLEFADMPLADEIVFHFLKILPDELYVLRLDALKLLVGFAGSWQNAALENEKYLGNVIQSYDADLIMESNPQDKLNRKTDWFKRELYRYTLNFLQEDLQKGLLHDDECKDLLTVFELLNILTFKDELGMLLLTERGKTFHEGEPDLTACFAENLSLLKQAHEANADVSPYVWAVWHLHQLCSMGLHMVGRSVDAKHPLRRGERTAGYYRPADAALLIKCLYPLGVVTHGPEKSKLLEKIEEHTAFSGVEERLAWLEDLRQKNA